jgi:uncharacterized membrane protein YhfC
MLTLALLVELVFVIGFPLALGAWLRRRWSVSWLVFLAGAVTFGLSQAVHLPLNEVIFARWGANWSPRTTALVLGLTAGLCEETARYVAYRWAWRDLRSWREALMFGAGHGGIESIVFVGLVVGSAWLNMALLQGSDLETWGLTAGQAAQLQAQLDAYWSQDWSTPLLAALERLFAITFHVGMAVLVLQAVKSGIGYLVLGIGLHTGVNALALLARQAGWSLAAVEGVVGGFALLAVGIVWWFRPKTPDAAPVEELGAVLPPLPVVPRRRLSDEERLRRQIQESKYEG